MECTASDAQLQAYEVNEIDKKPSSGTKIQHAFYKNVCPMTQFANSIA
jgi:hypothetical protein